MRRMVQLSQISRASFYRSLSGRVRATDGDMDLRDVIQRIALQWPSYGRPRITAELRRQGWRVNAKRVYRLMREDNLLCVRRRKFLVTTESTHNLPVYPNLARNMTLTSINQLWIGDITYLRLELEFVFLAVILDAFSRRTIGWALERTLEAELTISALRMAIGQRHPAPGLVHHSDRGVQYASQDYIGLLQSHHIQISMSRRGNPWDKDYASHCTSSMRCDTTLIRARCDSLMPCAFRGGFSPGGSYRQSFLLL
ncbi:MAG: IS3 family transposase [Acidobacteriales bacterium]|nr:IS3 family transposase [Terriglobales bacterium]